MTFKEKIKTIVFALKDNNRTILLDYANNPKPLYSKQKPHPLLQQLIACEEANYIQLLNKTLNYKDAIFTIKNIYEDGSNNNQPKWNNGHLPGLDIIMLYTMLAEYKPNLYVEIGSGTSTQVAYKSIIENKLNTQIISIDPNPRKNIDALCNKVYRNYLQDINLDFFKQLQPNDILFFDGSHMLLPNSDVMCFFLEVLPIIKEGVIIHIHDIYLPYDYPMFMCNRFYNEQYILANTLISNPTKYQIMAPNFYIAENNHLHSILNPIWQSKVLKNVETHGGSFWFCKK